MMSGDAFYEYGTTNRACKLLSRVQGIDVSGVNKEQSTRIT
jgi:hypothetical protein